ncbi:MAG: dihydropteroate synthase [Oscillospiraceae bacterium]|nr:dihydropteroate synthase [Oscillospiraceae bacterium]
MAILNVTPDSFSDGGLYFAPDKAIERAFELEAQGADILDIGGQSTRPGGEVISPEEEWRRLEPVLEGLRGKLGIPISIDTFYPEVAEKALALGASIVNDVSGIVSEEMAGVVRRYGARWVLMHNLGGADFEGEYEDVVSEVYDKLEGMAGRAMALGIKKERLCLDPGIGFGKSREDDLRLLANLRHVKVPGFRLLVGVSRKRITGGSEAGTLAAQVMAQLGGADILRTHDVARARQAMEFITHAAQSRNVYDNPKGLMEEIRSTGIELKVA